MKNYLTVTASLLASATLMLAATSAIAASVDINIGTPGVIVQPRPVYVQPRTVFIQPNYEREWSERRVRAIEWRDNPSNHGQAVSASAHARNDARKNNKNKNYKKKKQGR